MFCEAPCTIVLAPSPLGSTTTISLPEYTTSILAGTQTVTVTITPDAITTTRIEFFNVPIPDMDSTPTFIQPYPSLTVEDSVVTYTFTHGGDVLTSTRTIVLPPWPLITRGPPEDGDEWELPPEVTGGAPGTIDPPEDEEYPTPTWGWGDVPAVATPIEEGDDEPEGVEIRYPEDGDSGPVTYRLPCNVWFFNICINGFAGWEFILPPGVIGPGPPPPRMILPPNWTLSGKLPPWPRLTIPPPGGPPPTTPSKPEPCETQTASVCGTTTSYDSSVGPSTTVTTASSTYSTCVTIYGCAVEDSDDESTTGDACTAFENQLARRTLATAAAEPTAVADEFALDEEDEDITEKETRDQEVETDTRDQEAEIEARQAPCDRQTVVIIASDVHNPQPIQDFLEQMLREDPNFVNRADVHPVVGLRGTPSEFTAYYVVENYPLSHYNARWQGIDLIYSPLAWYHRMRQSGANPAVRSIDGDETELELDPALDMDPTSWMGGNETEADIHDDDESSLQQRATTIRTVPDYGNPLMSLPRGWNQVYQTPSDVRRDQGTFLYHLEPSESSGQRVYVVESDINMGHSELSGQSQEAALVVPSFYPDHQLDAGHGTPVGSLVVGKTLGAAPGATIIPVRTGATAALTVAVLHGLMLTLDELAADLDLVPRSVVMLAWSTPEAREPPALMRVFKHVINLMTEADIMLVVSGGNAAAPNTATNTDTIVPARWLKGASNAIIAGAHDACGLMLRFGGRFPSTEDTRNFMTFASGAQSRVAASGGGFEQRSGSSVATARIAGLIAYLRSLKASPWFGQMQSASGMKKMIKYLSKHERINDDICANADHSNNLVPIVWNGQVPNTDGGRTSQSCLLESPLPYNDLSDACPCPFQPPARRKRQEGGEDDSCPLPGEGGEEDGPSIGDLPVPDPIEWQEGEPGPLCEQDCGNPCDGFWCTPQPEGTPPDHDDPDPPPEPEPEPEDPDPEEPEEPDFDTADPSRNEKSCYNSGQKPNYGSITAAAESFCRDISRDPSGPVFGQFYREGKKQPSHNYHFFVSFEVFRGCEWEYSFDECMRYMKVPIDSCDCSAQGDKQGGRVTNNCIAVRLDPNSGI